MIHDSITHGLMSVTSAKRASYRVTHRQCPHSLPSAGCDALDACTQHMLCHFLFDWSKPLNKVHMIQSADMDCPAYAALRGWPYSVIHVQCWVQTLRRRTGAGLVDKVLWDLHWSRLDEPERRVLIIRTIAFAAEKSFKSTCIPADLILSRPQEEAPQILSLLWHHHDHWVQSRGSQNACLPLLFGPATSAAPSSLTFRPGIWRRGTAPVWRAPACTSMSNQVWKQAVHIACATHAGQQVSKDSKSSWVLWPNVWVSLRFGRTIKRARCFETQPFTGQLNVCISPTPHNKYASIHVKNQCMLY